MESEVTLRPVGDVELWYAEGEDRQWRLPLHVEWKMNPTDDAIYGLVLPGVSLYEIQLLAIRTLLKGYALDKREDRWLMPLQDLRNRLTKAPGINAAFYYHWPSGVHPPIPAPYHPMTMKADQAPMKVGDHREFADYIEKERGIPSDVVIAVLKAIAQLAPRWMIERRVPLDLGFCKLAALPFRTNWMEIIFYKMRPHPFHKILAAGKEMRDKLLASIGLPEALTSTHNIGMRSEGGHSYRLHYSLEAVPTQRFEQLCTEVERERMKPGTTSYVGHFEWSIQNLYEFIVEALQHHSRKSLAPWASVRICSKTGVVSFAPRHRRYIRLAGRVDTENLPVHITPPESRFSVFASDPTASDPTLLHPETGALPPLPAVSRAVEDVRQRAVNGDLDQSRPDGTPGLSVLDASEGPGSIGRLLPGDSTPSGNTSRMDRT